MRPESQRGVPDDEPRVVRPLGEARDVRELGVRRDERRPRVPDMLEQQLEQRDARHRAAADQHAAAAQLGGGTLGKQHDAAHGTVARDREVGQQQILTRVARILDRRDHADVERARRHLRIERAGHAIHDLRVQRHHAAVDRSVDGIAVDVGNPADAHHAALSRGEPPSSNVRRML